MLHGPSPALPHAVPHRPAQVTWSAKDGDRVTRGVEFGRLEGSAASILVAERVALNFMQRMSGIATATNAMVQVTITMMRSI